MACSKLAPQIPYKMPRTKFPSTVPNAPISQPHTFQTETQDQQKKDQCWWTTEMDDAMIDVFVAQIVRGDKPAKGFLTHAQCTKVFNIVLNECGVLIEAENVRHRMKTMKTSFSATYELSKMSNFGVDYNTGRVYVESKVWEKYIQARGTKMAKKMKEKKLRKFADLALMFGADIANGEGSVSGTDFATEEELDSSSFDTQEGILDDEVAFNNEYQFEVNYSTGDDPKILETPPPTSNIGDDIHGAPTSKRDIPPGIPPPIMTKHRKSSDMEESSSALQEMATCSRKIVISLDRQAATYEKEVGDKASVDIKEVLDIIKSLKFQIMMC